MKKVILAFFPFFITLKSTQEYLITQGPFKGQIATILEEIEPSLQDCKAQEFLDILLARVTSLPILKKKTIIAEFCKPPNTTNNLENQKRFFAALPNEVVQKSVCLCLIKDERNNEFLFQPNYVDTEFLQKK